MCQIKWAIFGGWVLGHASLAAAQATTVQLPSFSYFSVNTSVLVPDGGSAFMGGVSHASSGRVERGSGLPFSPFRNSAIGSTVGASSVRASVFVHDFEAMDQALLGVPLVDATSAAAAQFAASKVPAVQQAAAGLESVAELRLKNATADSTQQAEAREQYQQGLEAYEQGKPNVAKIYWQMADRRATGELKQLVQSRLRALASDTASSKSAPQPDSSPGQK